jgi:hypothetical protein
MKELTGLGILGVSAILPLWIARVALGLILAALRNGWLQTQTGRVGRSMAAR